MTINYAWIAGKLVADFGVPYTIDELAERVLAIDFNGVKASHYWRCESYLLKYESKWESLPIEEKIILLIDAMRTEIMYNG